ncbi:lycopene cyclase [Oscillochloris sp. ZM17-4]|uniref:lycopene cyclase family protein n=1 Tax=Oscillochloris sp. ZM17-4 TaxID=2866714 RepID=UPI001C735AB8|nr:lycopene cyclase family protein [Oscillochloris sp. ZM17-4]MBX0328402.1 lycopene cyclase [Oscillochloris sp. ZM17-4]
MHDFDSIIAGGGAAGLSLAYHLGQAGLRNHRVLLIDQVRKEQNDRTWCFWEVGDGPFEAAVSHRWEQLSVHSDRRSQHLAIAPYRYKLIQGRDFYRFMDRWLDAQPTITRLLGRVEAIDDRADGVAMRVDGQVITGDWAFTSIPPPPSAQPGTITLLQHFKGWVITTPDPVFDPQVATLMDFRVEHDRAVRFVYVLPYDAHTAMIEDTSFSPAVRPQADYDAGLRRYIREQLGVTRYAIQHVEYGVIPMTDAPFRLRPSPHVMTIGTAGGMTKASTGYTFQRIQRQSRRIAAQLRATGQPFFVERGGRRHALMDSVLLDVLNTGHARTNDVFPQLFRRNSPQRVLRFLDEESTLREDLALMATVDIPAFLAGTLRTVIRRAKARVTRRG